MKRQAPRNRPIGARGGSCLLAKLPLLAVLSLPLPLSHAAEQQTAQAPPIVQSQVQSSATRLAQAQPATQVAQPTTAAAAPALDGIETPIEVAAQRVVKLYGGAIGRERGYGVGVVVSASGQIVTAQSVLLESEAIRVVLPDGRREPAQLVARDPRRQLALLQIDAENLAHFTPASSAHLQPGDWVIAAANPFKVADGAEPVSTALGVLSGRSRIDARRRAQDFAFEGSALLVDVIVATPGSAGGALLDLDGNLVGVIGPAVISNRTNTWQSYAIPVEEVAALLRDGPLPAAPTTAPAAGEGFAARIGIRLFDLGGRERPAYVERVRPNSPAARAGVRADDLILSVSGQPVATCADYAAALAALRTGDRLLLSLKRRDELIDVVLSLEPRE